INKNLFRERIINEQVLTNSRLEVEAAKEGIAQAEFSIISKKTKVDFLKDRIDKLTITAPFSGVVVEKFVEKGEWIKQGQQLLRVMETNPLWVEVPVPEEIITRINEGVKAEVHVNMAEGTTFWAKVFRIIPKADTITRTFPVRLLIENPKGVLKVGMTARVSLPHGKKKKALMIPRDAVTTKLDKKIVFALAENATVKMFTVKTGATREGWVEVLSEGLTEKDQVVVRGGERLRPGQAVRIVKAGK
ncbi:MAG: efflux RND transporter periplasmic adaptor subunit, partial [Nitrospinota bacterium]